MPALVVDKIEIYVFRRRPRVQFLALKRSADRAVLPGVWQPVTGKIDRGESAIAAAAREVLEEIGVSPRRWWRLESMTVFFDPVRDQVIALPLFAAEIDSKARVTLSDEHDAHAFLSAAAAGRRFLWDSQRRGLAAARTQILRGGALARALEITYLCRDRSPRARTRL